MTNAGPYHVLTVVKMDILNITDARATADRGCGNIQTAGGNGKRLTLVLMDALTVIAHAGLSYQKCRRPHQPTVSNTRQRTRP